MIIEILCLTCFISDKILFSNEKMLYPHINVSKYFRGVILYICIIFSANSNCEVEKKIMAAIFELWLAQLKPTIPPVSAFEPVAQPKL